MSTSSKDLETVESGQILSTGRGFWSGVDTLVARDVVDSASVIVEVVDMSSDAVKLDNDSEASDWIDSGFVISSEGDKVFASTVS